MSTVTCMSPCVGYPVVTNPQAIVPSTAYTCSGISPLPLAVTVSSMYNASTDVMTFTVILTAPDNSQVISYFYTIAGFNSGGAIGSNIIASGLPNVLGNPGYANGSVGRDNTVVGTCYNTAKFPFAAVTSVTLGGSSSDFWKLGDNYVINAWACCFPQSDFFINGINVKFSRNPYSSINTQASGGLPVSSSQMTNSLQMNNSLNNNMCCGSICGASGSTCSILIAGNCGTIRVPIVNINAQTTIDGSDIGYVIFTICDEFTYYKETPLPPEDKCAVIYIAPDQVKQTVFRQCCPFMVTVLKGKGVTAREKAWSIWKQFSVQIVVSFETFYLNLILYAMSVYILSRILYGNFNIAYVLGKHFDKFIRDLGESRFCEFVEKFSNCNSPVFGYTKYFKVGNRIKSLK